MPRVPRVFSSAFWRQHLPDRLGEPAHLNLIALFVRAFGGFRAKVDFDLVLFRPHAFGILHAADVAAGHGVKHMAALEFGVAAGRGLMAMSGIAAHASAVTGVDIEVIGFDTGTGLPPPIDYRDHPEIYQTGDYPPIDKEALVRRLPANARIIYGDIANTVRDFAAGSDSVNGFVSIDVDYYWSTVACLEVFKHPDAEKYLPTTTLYVDDMNLEVHNPYCGELLAIEELNAEQPLRKITPFHNLRRQRIFKRPGWIDQIYTLLLLDHPRRTAGMTPERDTLIVRNPDL